MKKELKFTGYFMIIDNKVITSDEFKEVLPEKEIKYTYSEQYYTFTPQYIGNYLFIALSHGSPFPLPDDVRNIKTFEKQKNPRTQDQYEERQEYAIYDFTTQYLWVSNIYRKIMIWTVFQEKFKNKVVSIKEVYDEKDFIDTIKKVDEVRLSAVPTNLFSTGSGLGEELSKELMGYGATTAMMSLRYKNTNVQDWLRNKLANLMKTKGTFKNVMISGKDVNGLDVLFNSDSILKKIVIKTDLNDNGTFNDTDVLNILMKELN